MFRQDLCTAQLKNAWGGRLVGVTKRDLTNVLVTRQYAAEAWKPVRIRRTSTKWKRKVGQKWALYSSVVYFFVICLLFCHLFIFFLFCHKHVTIPKVLDSQWLNYFTENFFTILCCLLSLFTFWDVTLENYIFLSNLLKFVSKDRFYI